MSRDIDAGTAGGLINIICAPIRTSRLWRWQSHARHFHTVQPPCLLTGTTQTLHTGALLWSKHDCLCMSDGTAFTCWHTCIHYVYYRVCPIQSTHHSSAAQCSDNPALITSSGTYSAVYQVCGSFLGPVEVNSPLYCIGSQRSIAGQCSLRR